MREVSTNNMMNMDNCHFMGSLNSFIKVNGKL